MGLLPNYPDPILVCDVPASGTGLQPGILEILLPQDNVIDYPPVIQIYISATATVKVWAALRVSAASVPTLIRPVDVSSGGFSASDFYDLIPGLRFYQIEVTANTGEVIVEAGFGQLLRMMNNAPQGT